MVQRYREMADDPIRLRAFKTAIGRVIRPGAVVVDAGCGLGTYAILAARAGAARVYAIDEGPVIEVARQVVEKNGCADVVRIVRGRTTALEPVERADVIVFEDYVAGLLVPSVAETVRDLRARWLKPDGVLLPARASLWLAPVESNDLRRSLARFDDTKDRVAGIDLSPARRYAFAEPQNVVLRPATLLSAPALLRTVELADLATAAIAGQQSVEIQRDGVVHGIAVWFSIELPPTSLGTGPLDPPSAWRQVVLPFETPPTVSEGETVAIEVDAAPLPTLNSALVWRWQITTKAGTTAASSFDHAALAIDTKPLRA